MHIYTYIYTHSYIRVCVSASIWMWISHRTSINMVEIQNALYFVGICYLIFIANYKVFFVYSFYKGGKMVTVSKEISNLLKIM